MFAFAVSHSATQATSNQLVRGSQSFVLTTDPAIEDTSYSKEIHLSSSSQEAPSEHRSEIYGRLKSLPETYNYINMATTKTRPWDPAEHLKTKEDMIAYLEAALGEGDATLVAAVLGDIARSSGMTQIAGETGLGRESLYKALSPEGNPELATVLKVVRALGLRLHVTLATRHSS